MALQGPAGQPTGRALLRSQVDYTLLGLRHTVHILSMSISTQYEVMIINDVHISRMITRPPRNMLVFLPIILLSIAQNFDRLFP